MKPSLESLLQSKSSKKRAFFISLFLHTIFLLCIIFSSIIQQNEPITLPRRLVVQTISLDEKRPQRINHQNQSPKKEEPKQVETQKEEVAEEVPQPPSQNKSPEENTQEKQEEIAPKEEEKVSAPKKQEVKKTAPSPKKTPTKPPPKTKSAPKQPVKPAKKPSPTTSKSTSKTVKPTQKPKNEYNEKLLHEALQSLDRSQASSNKVQTSGGSSKGSHSSLSSIGSLNVDKGLPQSPGGIEGGVDGGGVTTSKEAAYIADLIRRLKLHVQLPEPGEVRLRLTLNRRGEVATLQVLQCKSDKIKKCILEKMKAVPFSPFGVSFSGEKTHDFLLRLSNDLSWSCM